MSLVLPASHPLAATLGLPPGEASRGERRLRLGIINIMPRLEAYEPLLLSPLARAPRVVEPLFIRLGSHVYTSSDHDHLDRHYRALDAHLASGPLDGLLLTGAPVEELAFAEVRYFPELQSVLEFARREVTSTLGLCWGAMALAHLCGVDKVLFPRKLFGVYEDRVLVPGHPILDADGGRFVCAHSRHSGARDEELEAAARDGRVRLLSRGEGSGYTLFETPDHRFVMHQGHPEYVAERIAFEWERDRGLGRTDVDPPRDFDPAAPRATWAGHRQSLIDRWLDYLSRGVTAAP